MKKDKVIGLIVMLVANLAGCHIQAQYAPVTTAATVSTAVAGQPVVVPVTVSTFNNINSITLYIDYDYSKIHFTQCQKNPLLTGNFSAGDTDLGNNIHRIIVGWYSLNPVTLAPGSWILKYVFTYIGGSTPLTWFDSGPSCKYTDGNGNTLIDTPTPSYYINGFVCGMLQSPGNITGETQVCQGTQNVLYSIDPVAGANGYTWIVPYGSVINAGNGTSSIDVSYSDSSMSGYVSVFPYDDCGNGLLSSLPVMVGQVPVANAGADTAILYGTSAWLQASGCPPFSTCEYSWEPAGLLMNPNVQNPQTFGLTTTTIFSVSITSAGTTCNDGDTVVVTVQGGPLTVNPLVFPDVICEGDSARLYANAGGGSGFYTYSWTCDPPGNPAWTSTEPNPVVAPSTETTYFLVLSDGISFAHGNVILDVLPQPPAPLIRMEDDHLVSDACCGNQWYFNNIAIPGANGQILYPQNNGIYYDIVTLEGCVSESSNILEVVITKTPDIMASTLQIIPNPAKDFFLLKCSGIQLKKIKVTFFSSDGVMVKEVNSYLDEDPNVHLIDIRDLTPGIYFVNIKTDNQNIIQKLVII